MTRSEQLLADMLDVLGHGMRPRTREVLRLLLLGRTYIDITIATGLTMTTARREIERVLKRLEVLNRHELLLAYLQRIDQCQVNG